MFLFVYSTKAELRTCAGFGPEKDTNEFVYQNELEESFGSINETNSEQTAELFQLIQQIREQDDTSSENFISSAKLLRYVVGFLI